MPESLIARAREGMAQVIDARRRCASTYPFLRLRQAREFACQRAIGVRTLTVNCQIIDEPPCVGGKKALRIPRDPQPAPKRDVALDQPDGTDPPTDESEEPVGGGTPGHAQGP